MSFLERLDDEALRARAAPYLSGPVPAHGLRVDVASGVTDLEDIAQGLRRVTFESGRTALYRTASTRAAEDLDAEELAAAVANSAGLDVPEVYRASGSELYTALPADDVLLGIDLPDIPTEQLRAILDRFAIPSGEFPDAELADWAQTAILDRTTAGRLLRTVDALTGTAARHPGEWAINGDRLIPIGFPDAWRSSGTPLPDRADLTSVRASVEALRPAFDRRRRGSWYDRTAAALQGSGSA